MKIFSPKTKIEFINKMLHIDNKEGIVVPFKFNKMQRYFQENKSHRNIILKHRQGGATSSILADMFTDCIIIPHTNCAVISHEGRATQRLLDRVQFYYDTMQEPKPEIGVESRSEKTFPSMHSSIYLGVAGSRAFGRGDTIRKILLSELPWYEDGRRILTGVEDAVPLSGELTIEGTPRGENNVFYEVWSKAREGKSAYKPFFFPWWWTADYTIPKESPYALFGDKGDLVYTSEEKSLAEKFSLTEGQIRWRRYKIAEKGGLFGQEFPEDEISCFLTVGDPVFDEEVLNTQAMGCYEGIKHKEGWIYWIPPVEGMTYVIGVDTSSGAPGGSYSTAVVLDTYWRVCATYQARIEPMVFAEILKKLGVWYNTAKIAVERNFTGYAVLGQLAGRTDLDNIGIETTRYPNLYRQRDYLTGKETSKLGWWTADNTREYMFTKLKETLPKVNIRDINLVRQLRSYRFIKYRPTPQTYDDLAIALLIANAVKAFGGSSKGYQGNVPTWSW